MSLSLGGMEHNQSHSRESIKITHNRVKRSRLFLNAFMRTFRRANAISASRKSATREFCKHDFKMEDRRTPERDEEEFRTRRWWTKRERERTQRETKKKRKERRLMFFLSSSSSYLWYLFSRIRAMIESNRGRFMYLHSCCVGVVVVVVVVFHVAREKKVMTKKFLFWFEFFQFFPNSHHL